MLRILVSLFLCAFIIACSDKSEPPEISIAINPWPGYELLYLAENKAFFKQVGLNIKLIQAATLSDAQRAYINGRVDGFSSTIIEAVQAQELGGAPLTIALLADYSNGGDVILSLPNYDSLASLKGKKIGCEVSSLGIYILARALAVNEMTLDDIEVINVEQGNALQSLQSGQIDAMVTYPPYSFEILRDTELKTHKIFTTAEIPNEILDIVSVSNNIIRENPQFLDKFQQAWQLSYDFLETNPREAIQIMAQREQISEDEFSQALADIHLLNNAEQNQLLQNRAALTELARDVCETLNKVGAFNSSCTHVETLFYPGI